jgi:thiol-disulfide isomerase/thioredoxin
VAIKIFGMNVIPSNDSDFQNLINNNNKVIVKYYADWCGSCKLFAPKYKRLSADERFSDVKFLDVNSEESPEARKLAGVDNLPFFATFKNGKLVAAQSTSKEENVVAMLENLSH